MKSPVRIVLFLILTLFPLLAAGCAASGESANECFFVRRFKERSLPVFDAYCMNVQGKDGSRLDIYFQIPYKGLRFEQSAGEYQSRYSVTFLFRTADATVTLTKDLQRSITGLRYEETLSSREDKFLQSFTLAPESYSVEIYVTDGISGSRYSIQKNILMKEFSQKASFASECLFLESVAAEGASLSLRPILPKQFFLLKDSLGLFQELYGCNPEDTMHLTLSYIVHNVADEESQKMMRSYLPFQLRVPYRPSGKDSVYYRSDSLMTGGTSGTRRIIQSFPKPPRGEVTIERKIFRRHGGIVDSSIALTAVGIVPLSFPRVTETDDLITAVSFIARRDEIDSLTAGTGSVERAKQLAKFWDIHGGVQRRREYDNRIAEANELFTGRQEGWRSPMGITYIVCGVPDYVDCQGSIQEVWYYGIGNRVLEVPFRLEYQSSDEGNYELIPFSVNEMYWQYFIDRWRRP
jgi:GWxTD domain-containing protein